MYRSRSSNNFNASNSLTRREVARKVMASLAALPECFTISESGSLLMGGLELAPTRMGSNSAVGVVYRSTISDENTIFDVVATKIVPNTEATLNEVKILQILTGYVMNKSVINFPITYGHRTCLAACVGARCLRQMGAPYIATFNELAGGDLGSFLKSGPSPAAAHSAMMQSLVALMTLHSIGICSEDSHAYNVLFHKVSTRGSWKYSFEGIDFLVPNCGQLFVAWDFDKSSFIENDPESRAFSSMWDVSKLLTTALPLLAPEVAKCFRRLLPIDDEDFNDYGFIISHLWTVEEYRSFADGFKRLAAKNLYVTRDAVNSTAYDVSHPA